MKNFFPLKTLLTSGGSKCPFVRLSRRPFVRLKRGTASQVSVIFGFYHSSSFLSFNLEKEFEVGANVGLVEWPRKPGTGVGRAEPTGRRLWQRTRRRRLVALGRGEARRRLRRSQSLR